MSYYNFLKATCGFSELSHPVAETLLHMTCREQKNNRDFHHVTSLTKGKYVYQYIFSIHSTIYYMF